MQRYFDEEDAVAIQGYDETHRVVYWNRASENLYGYTADEALGRRLEELIIPPAIRERVAAEIDTWLFHGLPPSGGLIELLRKDGSLVEVHSSHVIMRNPAGQPRMYCVDLMAHQRMALPAVFETAGDGRGAVNLYSCLSHEFRTPLNAAIGLSELLKARWGERLPGTVPEESEKLLLSTRRLEGVFDQALFLLGWARGDVAPRPRPVLLTDIVIKAIRDASPAATLSGITVRFDSPEEPGRVHADSLFLGRAVYAILLSALTVSPAGGTVGVTITSHPSGHEMVVVVTDAGTQVDPAVLCRVFTGEECYGDTYGPDQLRNVLYLPIAHHAAVATGAMFTVEPDGEGGNRSVLSVPVVAVD